MKTRIQTLLALVLLTFAASAGEMIRLENGDRALDSERIAAGFAALPESRRLIGLRLPVSGLVEQLEAGKKLVLAGGVVCWFAEPINARGRVIVSGIVAGKIEGRLTLTECRLVH